MVVRSIDAGGSTGLRVPLTLFSSGPDLIESGVVGFTHIVIFMPV